MEDGGREGSAGVTGGGREGEGKEGDKLRTQPASAQVAKVYITGATSENSFKKSNLPK